MSNGHLPTRIHNLCNRIDEIYSTATRIISAVESQTTKQLPGYLSVSRPDPISLDIEFAGIKCLLRADIPLSSDMAHGTLTTHLITGGANNVTLQQLANCHSFDRLGNIDDIHTPDAFPFVYLTGFLNALQEVHALVQKTPKQS